MKSILTTAGLAALGVASLQAAYAPGMTEMERSKPWSVSASLRGFYDDNYALRPSAPVSYFDPVTGALVSESAKKESFGLDVGARAGLHLPFERSHLAITYDFDMRWYEAREDNNTDYTHIPKVTFDHAFSDAVKMNLSDTFAVYQEPQLGGTDPVTDPLVLRSRGNNMQNQARFSLQADLSRTFGIAVGYSNGWYDYDQDGAGSYSALLDRMEHLGRLDLRWTMTPTTVGIFGYNYRQIDHDSKDSLFFGLPYVPDSMTDPAIRDAQAHYVYLGADHTFANSLTGSLRAGASSTMYPNALPDADDNTISPYVDASLTHTYRQGSFAQLGVRYDRNQTDAYAYDQATMAIYATVTHQITAKLTANVVGQIQYGEFSGGLLDGEVDSLYLVGLNLGYQISTHFGAEIGYNYDRLDSDMPTRAYDRNRVYIGVRASY